VPTDAIYNVLFLCTGNSARSILGEALLHRLGQGRFRGFSAGSHPKGEVHPLALRALAEAGYPTQGLRSKSWDEFAVPDAPRLDFVFTVCDNAAGETCPLWPGQPMTAHWGIEDPAAVEGTEFQRRAAFEDALRFLRNRITAFNSLPIASLDRMTLQARLHGIGSFDGATAHAPQIA
jgi:arsenate reductase